MKFKVKFPLDRGGRNWRAVRDAVHLGSGFEGPIVAAANRAKDSDQEVVVSRSYGPASRFVVMIVDRTDGKRLERRKKLAAALGRVRP